LLCSSDVSDYWNSIYTQRKMTGSPVWSVILLLVLGLIGVGYIIFYILRQAYLETLEDAEETSNVEQCIISHDDFSESRISDEETTDSFSI